MPTTIYNLFTLLVVQEIQSQLQAVTDIDINIVIIINSVRSEAISDIVLYGDRLNNGRYPKRSPNISFAHADSQYPSFIIEISLFAETKTLSEAGG